MVGILLIMSKLSISTIGSKQNDQWLHHPVSKRLSILNRDREHCKPAYVKQDFVEIRQTGECIRPMNERHNRLQSLLCDPDYGKGEPVDLLDAS